MTSTLTAMEARQNFGEILNRVNLVHDQFIIERNGKPLAAIVPIKILEELQAFARKSISEFLSPHESELSDEEAMKLANEAKHESRQVHANRIRR